MDKRLTVTIDEANWQHFEKDIRSKLLSQGKGDLYFSTYVNICLSNCPFTIDEIVAEAKKRKKSK